MGPYTPLWVYGQWFPMLLGTPFQRGLPKDGYMDPMMVPITPL